MKRRTVLIGLAGLLLLAAVAYVAWQAGITLVRLEQVERDRDTWQRPGDIMTSLDLHGGEIVVDLGSGSGYFSDRASSSQRNCTLTLPSVSTSPSWRN